DRPEKRTGGGNTCTITTGTTPTTPTSRPASAYSDRKCAPPAARSANSAQVPAISSSEPPSKVRSAPQRSASQPQAMQPTVSPQVASTLPTLASRGDKPKLFGASVGSSRINTTTAAVSIQVTSIDTAPVRRQHHAQRQLAAELLALAHFGEHRRLAEPAAQPYRHEAEHAAEQE